MNRQEFFNRLEYLLRGIPESERMDALAYYNDYFDEAGVENEQQVIQELGSPEQVAQNILEDYYRNQQSSYEEYGSPKMEQNYQTKYTYGQQKQQNEVTLPNRFKNMNHTSKILLIIILVLTFPLWIGVVAGLFGALVGLLGGLFGVVVGVGGAGIGVLVGGVVCLVAGILRLFSSPLEGIVTIGVGALFLAISILLVLVVVLLLCKWLPAFIKMIAKWAKGLFHPKRGGDEI